MVNYVIFASMDYHSRVDIMLKIAIKVYQRNGSSAALVMIQGLIEVAVALA